MTWEPVKEYPGLPPNVDDVDGETFTPIEILENPETGEFDVFYFDARAADHAVAFFELFITHVEGDLAGETLELSDWQRRDIRHVFGWKWPDGTRRFTIFFLFIARKNGKTTEAAGLALLLTCADGEIGAQVYVAANDKDQARLTYEISKRMAEASPDLKRRLKPMKTAILHELSGSTYRILSSDVRNKDGLNIHGAIIDELHEHPTRRIYDVVTTGTGARSQPLVIVTTTAGVDPHSIEREVYDHAKRVRDGKSLDRTLYPAIYEADEDDDWHDPETWRKANPNLGISVQLRYLHQQHRKAVEIPGYENTFKRYHLNMHTEQAKRWLPMDAWHRSAGRRMTEEELRGRECYLALDLSSTQDITALVGVFPRERRDDDPEVDPQLEELLEELALEESEDDPLGLGEAIAGGQVFDVLAKFWVPSGSVEPRARRDSVPYPVWIREGFLTPTKGAAINPRAMRSEVNRWGELFDVREVAVDPWNGAEMIINLEEDGFEVSQVRQGVISMNGPSKAFLRAVLMGQIIHGANPVLDWMAANVAVDEREGGLIKPSKERSPEKIDGIVCLIMALGRGMLSRPKPPSVYESRGVRSL